MKSKTCCFTGHRILSAEQSQALAGRIERAVRLLYARGVCYFGAGGALGFDMLAAETVLRLREEFAIYAVASGRINVAGMTPDNMAPLCEAIVAVL